MFHFANSVESDVKYTTDQWIINTGATDHITPYAHLLRDVKPANSLLHLPNVDTAEVVQIGNICLSPIITLHNVLCVPSFTYNLLSVSHFLKDTKYELSFTSQCYKLMTSTW